MTKGIKGGGKRKREGIAKGRKQQGGCKGRGDLRTRAIMDSPLHVRRVREFTRAPI